jgi:serine protease Do
MQENANKARTLRQGMTAVFMAVTLAAGALLLTHTQTSTAQAQNAPAPTPAFVAGLPDFTEIIARTEGSVVNIRTTESVAARSPQFGPGGDPYDMFRWFFGPDFAPPGERPQGPRGRAPQPQQQPQERTVPRGVGSGFIISADGYILTNNHVVEGSNGIFVTMTDSKEYPAKVIGADPRTDVALLKIDAKDLKPLAMGDSRHLKKGQWVLAIGSPFGLDSTVTAGIVSAINRDTGDYLPFIQTDVAVNPGNSGGPLLNLSGEVIGINSQIVSRSGGFMGISLAIPIEDAMRVVDQLKTHGKVTRGRIGVQIGEVSEEVAKALGLGKARGASVSRVEKDSPAGAAGVMAGDVITSFNGAEIKRSGDLVRMVGETKPDTQATLEVWRRGRTLTLKVTVGEMPSEPQQTARGGGSAPQPEKTDVLGLAVVNVPEKARKDLGITGGVQVREAREPAAAAGLEPGDIILTVGDTDITDASQFAKVVAKLDKTGDVALLVLSNGQTRWIIVQLPGK